MVSFGFVSLENFFQREAKPTNDVYKNIEYCKCKMLLTHPFQCNVAGASRRQRLDREGNERKVTPLFANFGKHCDRVMYKTHILRLRK